MSPIYLHVVGLSNRWVSRLLSYYFAVSVVGESHLKEKLSITTEINYLRSGYSFGLKKKSL